MQSWVHAAREYGRLSKQVGYRFDDSYSWSGKSLRDIARRLGRTSRGFWSDYEFFYAISSSMVHSTAMSIREYMRRPFGSSYQQLSQRRPYHQDTPILASSWCLLQGMLTAADHNVIAKDYDLARLTLDTQQLLSTLKYILEK
jgi:hypothetical protein